MSACVQMLPRLTAAESLLAAQRAAVGGGTLKKGKAEQIVRGWQRAAHGARPIQRRHPSSVFAAAGIPILRVMKAAANG